VTEFDAFEPVRLQPEAKSLHKRLQLEEEYHGLFGRTPVMQDFFELIEKVSVVDAPIVITGQKGTGKKFVAQAIHNRSPRCWGPFIKVNCAGLNGNLLERELFGYVKGAFGGEDNSRIGRFEAAHGGTIFLDEIGDLSLTIQIKLLRTLEEKEIERVGASGPIKIDVRIISASNKNLEALIANGRFREDLYFRLNVFPITCPPLCDYTDDIPIIVQHLIQSNNLKTGKNITGATSEAIDKMTAYAWPGNVRELRNAIDYAFAECPCECIDVTHLPATIGRSTKIIDNADLEKRAELIRVLRQTGGNRSEAARILGVSRVTVWKQINKFGIELPRELELS
jgi:two-component system, NtrC family, response regulator HydG